MNKDYTDDELKHYGVLGMKWGVRHDRADALTKSTAKLRKIEDKAIKYNRKAEVLRSKRAVKIANAQQKLERAQAFQEHEAGKIWGIDRSAKAARKVARAQKEYSNAVSPVRKYESLAAEYNNKAAKWWGQMEREFGTQTVSSLDTGMVTTGKNYADYYMNKYAKYKIREQKRAEREQKKLQKT